MHGFWGLRLLQGEAVSYLANGRGRGQIRAFLVRRASHASPCLPSLGRLYHTHLVVSTRQGIVFDSIASTRRLCLR
jgi:hypothetical protein